MFSDFTKAWDKFILIKSSILSVLYLILQNDVSKKFYLWAPINKFLNECPFVNDVFGAQLHPHHLISITQRTL
jgi:hypothetical protein